MRRYCQLAGGGGILCRHAHSLLRNKMPVSSEVLLSVLPKSIIQYRYCYRYFRATLCVVSEVLAVGRCACVRLFVTILYCIVSRWLKISSNFFLRLVAHHSSFSRPFGVTKFRGIPISGGVKYTGMKILQFSFISETIRDIYGLPMVGCCGT